jgi:hypothetical protein
MWFVACQLSTGNFLRLLTGSWRLATAGCEADTYFDHELICLLADDVQDQVVTIHRSLEVKILSIHRHSLHWQKRFCRNI